VVIPSTEDGQPNILVVHGRLLTCRHLHTGRIVWKCYLPEPILSQPANLGQNVVVALSDQSGTFVTIDNRTGQITRCNTIQEKIGSSPVVFGSRLIVPASQQRLYIFQYEQGRGAYVHVLQTGHTRDSLHAPPLIFQTSQGVELILVTASGPGETAIRQYPLPLEASIHEVQVKSVSEAQLRGWCTYPEPMTGNRYHLITDAGDMARIESSDKLKIQKVTSNTTSPHFSPSAGLTLANDRYWYLRGTQLSSDSRHINLDVAGEPAAPGWKSTTSGIRCWTLSDSQKQNCHAIGFDPQSETVIWTVKLKRALQPSISPLIMDDHGSFYFIRGEQKGQSPVVLK
jgi:hypothetical protein